MRGEEGSNFMHASTTVPNMNAMESREGQTSCLSLFLPCPRMLEKGLLAFA